MRYLVIRIMKKDMQAHIWSEWDNSEQAEHDCQIIHNDSYTCFAFVAKQTDFVPDDKEKRLG